MLKPDRQFRSVKREDTRSTSTRETCHKDRLGRLIGGHVTTTDGEFVAHAEGEPLPAGVWGTYSFRPGPFFAYCPHSTRNGSLFGASQSTVYFATAAERDAAVEKYFRDMEKRARKTAEKAAA